MILMIIFVGLILAIAGIIVEILLICKIIEPEYLFYTEKRMGIYRTVSIVGPGNGNYLGMYCLMSLFFVHSLLKGPKKIFYSAVLIINIFLTFSRQTWLSGILYLILKNEKRDLKYFISVFLLIFSLLLIFPITFSETRYDPEVYYRSFTILKSLEILKSNLLVGKSPGTFGGVASVVFKSNLYDDWPDYFKDMVHRIGSIDAFWFSILAETGLLGFISLLLFFISLYKYLHNLDNAKNKFYKIGHDLSIFCLALVIMNFMNGFNRAFLVYTFFTLCGTYISFYRNLTSGLKFNVNESNLP
ncbi:MAG: hypothetical protein NC921_01700 [Candidatus Omnitrophica bacterium]|nr:hypothetical protein [Candidatus Omnitrophota bacterium]